jgi:protein phosphatase
VGKGSSLTYCDRSDIGRRRSNNQDSRAVLPPSSPQQYRTRGWMFLVADGMGAHAAGELASAIAAERVPLVYEKTAQRSPPLALRRSIEQINGEINSKGESSPEFKGMGTTCSTLALLPRGAIVGHIGDSRVYRVRNRTIEQLSRDHSLVWELESAGGMSREAAAEAAPKNIITRSMGPHPHVEIDLEGPHPVEEGDVFVLCSDGLSGQASDEEIGLLASDLEPREAADALVSLAFVRGAPDNVTVIVAKAGREEVTKTSAGDTPWPLSDQPDDAAGPSPLPWRWLAAAAVTLFGLLVLFGMLERLGETEKFICWLGIGGLALAFVGSIAAALIGFIAPPSGRVRVLVPGKLLGRGPYRSYSCQPSATLLEGILGSIEAASNSLGSADRDRTLTLLVQARQKATAGAFQEASLAAAEALAVFRKAIELSRSDDTTTSRRAPPADAP